MLWNNARMTQSGKPVSAYLALILTALIIGAVFVYLSGSLNNSRLPDEPPTVVATWFPAPLAVPAFSLIDHHDRPFDNSHLQGQWHFLFFGYTHCPDVCPATLSVMNSIAHKIGEDAGTRFLFVTVDPARDTPEQLAGFVSYFNSGFIGLTGDLPAILQLSQGLGIMSSRETDEGDNYNVEHTSSVLLLNPEGQYAALFSAPHSADIIAGDFNMIKAHYESQQQARKK